MAETTGPSWSDIPVDLAGRILRHLPAYVYRLRFAAVCPQWRAAARLGPLPPPLPLLLLSDSTVYSLPGSKPSHLLVPGCCTGYTDVCGNWLFFSGDDGCFLRNPFSNTTMALPALSLDRIRKMSLEYEPERCKLLFCSLHLVVAIVSLWSGRRLAVCKPGAATSWLYVSADSQYSDFVGMTFHQGKLYALTSMDELFAIEVSLDHSTGDPWPCYAQGVTGIAIFETTAGVQNEFEVFEANFRQSQWTKVTTLGDD
nr:unnamed protein product [Digitaria exilis]